MWMEVQIEGREEITWTRNIVVEVPDTATEDEVSHLGADVLNDLTSSIAEFEREDSQGIEVGSDDILKITIIEQHEDGQPDVIFARGLDDDLIPIQ